MATFWSEKKILVTGASGFLGRHLVALLKERGAADGNLVVPQSRDCDLRRWENCQRAVAGVDLVIHLAVNVGGIAKNIQQPGAMLYDNLVMGTLLMEAARQAGVKKFVGIGSVCEYPKFTAVPFRESELWNGYPEETNAPYGLAKKMMLVQGQAYRQQYGFCAIHPLLVNLYGPGDNFDPTASHVIAALIRKMVEARELHQPTVVVWGSGQASREFLFVRDAAEAIVLATERYDGMEPFNVGCGVEISIRDLAALIARLAGYRGTVVWDATKPDGQPRRALDVSRARDWFGFTAHTDLAAGLQETIAWYESQANGGIVARRART